MIRLGQPGTDGRLLDMPGFLPVIEQSLRPDAWHLDIEWCTGEASEQLESIPTDQLVPHEEFVRLLAGLRQTIDGTYRCIRAGQVIAELRAVDSCFWDISGPEPFEVAIGAMGRLYPFPSGYDAPISNPEL